MARESEAREQALADIGTLPTISADAPRTAPPKRRWVGAVGWLLAICMVAGGVVFHRVAFEPALRKNRALGERLSRSQHDESTLRARAASLETRLAALGAERDSLRASRDELAAEAGRLSETVAERDAEIARLRAAQRSLEGRMADEIARGEIEVENVRGELRVKLDDQVLFSAGDATLSERGGAMLRRVAESLASLEGYVIDVGGHTDGQPVTDRIAERFPTNWELSTARATNVVRFLAEECHVPGERLAATGYAQYRPVASNRTSTGRKRNRRIELTLRPRTPAAVASAAPAAP